ncbi:protein rep [Mucisphaera calidilacus]|uniref:protein rep n=1 Tax=Mucisphaera calidilacus TaxID=2527982 RepID=UPI0011A68907|nr:protein rep [Mucisphaera calidilacus]
MGGPEEERDDDFAGVVKRISRYTPAHARAVEMAEYLRTIDTRAGSFDAKDRTNYAYELEQCGTWLEFAAYSEDESLLLASAKFCQRYRLCPFCALRRCSRSLQDNAPRVRHALDEAQADHSSAYLALLTLTVRNGPDLTERFNHLVENWRHLTDKRRAYLAWAEGKRRRREPWTFAAAFSGGTYAIEIKRGKGSKGWHPHLHAAVLVTGDTDQNSIRREWESITGDSFIADFRPFHSFEHTNNPSDEAIADDLAEVLKYPLKFGDITIPDNWHAELALSGRRLRGCFGSMYGIKEPDDLTDRYADRFADLPYVHIAAKWMGDGYELVNPQLRGGVVA